MIRPLFDVLIPLILAGVGSFMLYWFWRTLRKKGLWAAVRQLGTQRYILTTLLVALLIYVRAGLVFIDPREVGVVVSILQPRGIRPQPLPSGLHWVWPLMERLYTYPIVAQAYTMSSTPDEGVKFGDDSIRARTADGQLVYMDISVLFRIDPAKAVFLHTIYQDRYVDVLLRPGIRSLVRREASQYTVDQINSERRADVQRALDTNIRVICRGTSLIIEGVLLRNIAFSPEYARSVERKMMANQGVTQSTYEAEQIANLAEGEARRIERTARAEARAIVEKAEASARAIELTAEAEANALTQVGRALRERPDLLTYRYIDKLAPNVRAMLLPSQTPVVLPLGDVLADEPQQAAAGNAALRKAIPEAAVRATPVSAQGVKQP